MSTPRRAPMQQQQQLHSGAGAGALSPSPSPANPIRIARIQYVRTNASAAAANESGGQTAPLVQSAHSQHVSSQAAAHAVAGLSSPAAAAAPHNDVAPPSTIITDAAASAGALMAAVPPGVDLSVLLAQHAQLQQTHAATATALAQLRADRASLLHTSQVHAQQLAHAHALLLAAHAAERTAEQNAEAQAAQHAQLAAANVALSSALQSARSEAERNAAAHAHATGDLSLRESVLVGREAALAFCAAAAAGGAAAASTARPTAMQRASDALSQADTATDAGTAADGAAPSHISPEQHERVLEELQALRLEHTALEHEHSALRHARLGAAGAAPRRGSSIGGTHSPCAADAERVTELEASVELHAQTALLLQDENAMLEERLASTRVQLASSLGEVARANGEASELLRAEREHARQLRQQLGEMERTHAAQVASFRTALSRAAAEKDACDREQTRRDQEAARALGELASQKADLLRELSLTQQRLQKSQSKLASTESSLASTLSHAQGEKGARGAFEALQLLYESGQTALREAQARASKSQAAGEKLRAQRDSLAKQADALQAEKDALAKRLLAGVPVAPASAAAAVSAPADGGADADSIVEKGADEESKSNSGSVTAPAPSSVLSPPSAKASVPRRERELRAELHAATAKLAAAEKDSKALRSSLAAAEGEAKQLRERLLLRMRTAKTPASASASAKHAPSAHADSFSSPPASSRAAAASAAAESDGATLSPPLPPLFAPVLADQATQTEPKRVHNASTTVSGLPPADADVAAAADAAATVAKAAETAQAQLAAAESAAESARAELRALQHDFSELHTSYEARAEELDQAQQQLAELMEGSQRSREEDLAAQRDAMLAEKEAELACVAAGHERALDALRDLLTTEKEAELDRVHTDHRQALDALRESLDAQSAAMREEKDAALAQIQSAHEQSLGALRESSAALLEARGDELTRARDEHQEALAALRHSLEEQLAQLEAARDAEVESLRGQVDSARSEAERERAQNQEALTAVQDSLAQAASGSLEREGGHRAAMRALQSALEEARSQLELQRSAHEAALAAAEASLAQKHAEQLEVERAAAASDSAAALELAQTGWDKERELERASRDAERLALEQAVAQLRLENERLVAEVSAAAAAAESAKPIAEATSTGAVTAAATESVPGADAHAELLDSLRSELAQARSALASALQSSSTKEIAGATEAPRGDEAPSSEAVRDARTHIHDEDEAAEGGGSDSQGSEVREAESQTEENESRRNASTQDSDEPQPPVSPKVEAAEPPSDSPATPSAAADVSALQSSLLAAETALREAQAAHSQREEQLVSDMRDMEGDLAALQGELDEARERLRLREQEREHEQQQKHERESVATVDAPDASADADAGADTPEQEAPSRAAPSLDEEGEGQSDAANAASNSAAPEAVDATHLLDNAPDDSSSASPTVDGDASDMHSSVATALKSVPAQPEVGDAAQAAPAEAAAEELHDAQPSLLDESIMVETLEPVGGPNAFWPLERHELLALVEAQARSIEQLLVANADGVSLIEQPHPAQPEHEPAHTRGPSVSRLHLDLEAALQQIVAQQSELAELQSELLLHERMTQAERAAAEEAQAHAARTAESSRRSEKKLAAQVAALRDQLRSAESERNTLRARVGGLVTQADADARAAELERSALRTRLATVQAQVDSAQRESALAARAAASEINNMELRLERVRDDCLRQVADERAREVAAALDSAAKRAAQEAQRTLQVHAAEQAALRASAALAQQELESLRVQLASLAAQRASIEAERDTLARIVEQQSSQHAQSAAVVSQRESALSADLAAANHSIGQLHEQMLAVRNQLAASEMSLRAAQSVTQVRGEQGALVEQLQAALRESESTRDSMRKTIAARDSEAAAAASREDEAHEQRARLQRLVDESQLERQRLEAQVNDLRAQLLQQGRSGGGVSGATSAEDLEEEVQFLQQQLSGKDGEWEALLREQAAEHDAALEASQRALLALQNSLDDSRRLVPALREQLASALMDAATARTKEQAAASALATLQRESARLAAEVAEQSRGERAALLELIRVQEIELEESAAEARGDTGVESAGAMAALLQSGGEQLAESQRLSHALVCAQAEVQRLDLYARALEQQLRAAGGATPSPQMQRESFAGALSPLSPGQYQGRGSFAPGSPVLSPNSARKARPTLGDSVAAGASFESVRDSANKKQQQQQQR